jgi:hypothetical protein
MFARPARHLTVRDAATIAARCDAAGQLGPSTALGAFSFQKIAPVPVCP